MIDESDAPRCVRFSCAERTFVYPTYFTIITLQLPNSYPARRSAWQRAHVHSNPYLLCNKWRRSSTL